MIISENMHLVKKKTINPFNIHTAREQDHNIHTAREQDYSHQIPIKIVILSITLTIHKQILKTNINTIMNHT